MGAAAVSADLHRGGRGPCGQACRGPAGMSSGPNGSGGGAIPATPAVP